MSAMTDAFQRAGYNSVAPYGQPRATSPTLIKDEIARLSERVRALSDEELEVEKASATAEIAMIQAEITEDIKGRQGRGWEWHGNAKRLLSVKKGHGAGVPARIRGPGARTEPIGNSPTPAPSSPPRISFIVPRH